MAWMGPKIMATYLVSEKLSYASPFNTKTSPLPLNRVQLAFSDFRTCLEQCLEHIYNSMDLFWFGTQRQPVNDLLFCFLLCPAERSPQ